MTTDKSIIRQPRETPSSSQKRIPDRNEPISEPLWTGYDGANRVSTLSGSGGKNYVTQAQYWPNGAVASLTRGNSVGLNTSLTSRQQLNCAIESMVAANPNSQNNNGAQLWTECASWNPNDTLGRADFNHGGSGYLGVLSFTEHYWYDGLNRLKAANDMTGSSYNWARNFHYDQWGNMYIDWLAGPNNLNTPTSNVYSSATNHESGVAYNAMGNIQAVGGNTLTYNGASQLSGLTPAQLQTVLNAAKKDAAACAGTFSPGMRSFGMRFSLKGFDAQIQRSKYVQYPNPATSPLGPLSRVKAQALKGSIALYPNFFTDTSPRQAGIVLHENLHVYTGWSDSNVFSVFQQRGITPNDVTQFLKYGNTDGITTWILRGCQ